MMLGKDGTENVGAVQQTSGAPGPLRGKLGGVTEEGKCWSLASEQLTCALLLPSPVPSSLTQFKLKRAVRARVTKLTQALRF